jgi:hypothetical protein
MARSKNQAIFSGMLLTTALLGLAGLAYSGQEQAEPLQTQSCPPGQFACVDLKGVKEPCKDHSSDAKNCGSCGHLCQKSEKCEAGQCVSTAPACPPGQFACVDLKGVKEPCKDHSSDMKNCGTCGHLCQKSEKCAAGQCVSLAPACPPGQLACTDAKGGKEPCKDHSSDMRNCGTCGNVCQKSEKCAAGQCVSLAPACPPGQLACTDAKGGKEPCKDHSSDMRNCGTCGNVCQKSEKCAAGQCVPLAPACPPGQLACTDAKGGKEPCKDHSADRNNCGSCGNVCQKGTNCVAGVCR